MALRWECADAAPPFLENEIAGLIARDPAVRRELVETFTGRREIGVLRNEMRLTRRQIRDLAALTGICRRPSAWLMRETMAANLRWIFACRSVAFSLERVREMIAANAMTAWKNFPSFEERIEEIPPVFLHAMALARLQLLPHRVIVIESPLSGWSSAERSLVLDTLYVSCETEALKLIIAERRDDLPPFCDRMMAVERRDGALVFAETL